MSDLIAWRCNECGNLIADGDGYVEVNDRKARVVRLKWKSLDGGGVIGGLDLPELVEWQSTHAVCDPNPGNGNYHFSAERIKTVKQALRWTLHLYEKDWAHYTDWDRFIYRNVLEEGK